MRIRLRIQARSVSPRLADNLHLRLKNIGIFLGCVKPVLAAMRLKIRLCELTTDLTGRDARDDTTLLRFIRQFAMSSVIDRATRLLRRLTCDGHDLSHLLRCKITVCSGARCVAEDIFDGSLERGVWLATLNRNERIEGLLPSPAPQSDLLPTEANLYGNLIVSTPFKRQQNDSRTLNQTQRSRRGFHNSLEDFELLFRQQNLGRLARHHLPP
jgi:hypothetical protein